ncbi:MAG: hypothetical protein QOE61_3074 [Micromonosporaceae bacterium]|nr:hypothetical protein [Micromonosporaceae bacterium]
MTNFGTKIEYELEQSGVALLAADEGITDDALPNASVVLARKRATPILTRRVKQAIAEWYVLDMLEKSWAGLIQHTEQGFNIVSRRTDIRLSSRSVQSRRRPRSARSSVALSVARSSPRSTSGV